MPGWFDEWLIFVGVMALGQFSPGPDMLLLTRTALASGRGAGCATALGIVCGLALHALIAVTGVAVILVQGGWVGVILSWAAAIYLVGLAVPLIRGGWQGKALSVGKARSGSLINEWTALGCWKRGLYCNLLNPKVAIFLAGVTAPFLQRGIQSGAHSTAWPLLLWLTIVFEGLILWCAWSVALQLPKIKHHYLHAAHWFDLAFGLALLIVAVFLLI